MTKEIGKYKVTLKDSLTWGEMQEIEIVLTTGATISSNGARVCDPRQVLAAKHLLLETCITRIKEGDKECGYSKEWMNALSSQEGEKLYNAVDAIAADAKKK